MRHFFGPRTGPLCALVGLMLAAAPATAGVILNTLEGYDNAERGWSGGVNAMFSASGGNTEKVLLETGGKVQWQNAVHRWRLLASGGYEESGGVETARNVVVHLRHNRVLAANWSTISFVQVQHNPFQQLRSRWLLGLGPRYDLVRDERGLAAVGLTPMLEIERLQDETGHTARGRLSVFLHLARKIGPSAQVDGVVFWQPLFSDLSASRATANVTLAVDVVGEVDLKVGAAVEYNERAPVGVDKTDWSTFTGLGVTF